MTYPGSPREGRGAPEFPVSHRRPALRGREAVNASPRRMYGLSEASGPAGPPTSPAAVAAPRSAGTDHGAGPLVRPYTVTGGRTRPSGTGLDMISLVVAAHTRVDWRLLEPEHADILRLCRRPVSVAEVSARLDLPMAVVKVLLGDLISRGDVHTRAPRPVAEAPEMNILQAVLDGIRKL